MANLQDFYDKINGKTVALLGLGISNLPLLDLLAAHGAKISVHDKKTFDAFSPDIKAKLEILGARLVLGENYLDVFDEDIIVKAPGIRRDKPAILSAVHRGAWLTSETELFFNNSNCKKYAVTGSDGKTTTTTLTHLILSEQARRENDGTDVFVGGNIGNPLFASIEKVKEQDVAVLELSSFQLHAMDIVPDGVIITNVSPNHLDWHTDYNEYIESKKKIFAGMKSGRVVLNYDCEITRDMIKYLPNECEPVYFARSGKPADINCSCVYFENGIIYYYDSREERTDFVMSVSDILIPGVHNIENYMAAAALLYGTVECDIFSYIARTFKGVAHRIELVREHDGVKYYNSSIDSSPTRTMAALNSFGEKKVIAIMGGYDKNIPFEPMGDCVCEHAKVLVLTGSTAGKIYNAVISSESYKNGNCPEIIFEDDFKKAVVCAKEHAKDGDVVILTPACASFDKFKNFEERGNVFKEIVGEFK